MVIEALVTISIFLFLMKHPEIFHNGPIPKMVAYFKYKNVNPELMFNGCSSELEAKITKGLLLGDRSIYIGKNGLSDQQLEALFKKILYRSPMVMYVDRYQYRNRIFTIKYFNHPKAELTSKQEAVLIEAKRVTGTYQRGVTTERDKVEGILKYFKENIVYNNEAQVDFLQNNCLTHSDNYVNAQTVYGAMVEKNALCSGFARAFNLLCDLSYVKSQLVIGTYNGIPHFWNKVKVEGKWYQVDATNNINELEDPRKSGDFRKYYEVCEVY